MQAYISISFSKRQLLNQEVEAMIDVLNSCAIRPLVFVDQYQFEQSQEHVMMEQAFADIDNADFLIAETSDKAIGIGVEVGYARAKNKPIIYLRNSKAEHSTTVAGSSDYNVLYENADDLQTQLKAVIEKILLKK